MVVGIHHEKLATKLHTDTFSYVKTCTRTRPCKSIHLCRGTSFYSKDVSQTLALVKPMFSDMVSYVKSPCKSIHLCRGTSFYSKDVSQTLALVKPMFSDMVSYVKSCTLRRICKWKSCGWSLFQAHQWEVTYRHVFLCEN